MTLRKILLLLYCLAGLALLSWLLWLRAEIVTIRPIQQLQKIALNFEEYKKSFARASADHLTRAEIRYLRSVPNEIHISKAQELGVSGLNDSEDVQKAFKEGKLVFLEDGRFWHIDELRESVPYVTPDMKKLLELIGKRFQENLTKENLPIYRYTISSALRTFSEQKALTRINRNASKTLSSHSYGTASDILFRGFSYSAGNQYLFKTLMRIQNPSFRKADFDALGTQYTGTLRTIMGKTLMELQEEGKCYIRYETREPNFHITLATKLP